MSTDHTPDNITPINGRAKDPEFKKCVVPSCNVGQKKNSQHGMCKEDEEFLERLLFMLPRITLNKMPVPRQGFTPPHGGLVLPR